MSDKKCKNCNEEFNSSDKCPNCGKDHRNWFASHKLLSFGAIIIAIIIISVAIAGDINGGDLNTSPANTKPEITKKTEASKKPQTAKYSDGTYLVGKDIQSGLYKVTLKNTPTKMGYIERAKDVNMQTDSIIANIVLTGNGYVEILATDVAVKLQGVEIEPIKLEDMKPDLKTEVSDGIYLVNYNIPPGTYNVEVTDKLTGMGYVQRSRSVAMGFDDIIANEIVQSSGYVKIEADDFAVRLQGVKITLEQ